jgi:S1-C subfamily serine protease
VVLEGESPAGAAPAVTASRDATLDPAFTLGRSDWDGGVAIGSVRADGPAALYGLRAGDRLRAVNGRTPASVEDALALLGLGRARVALLRIERPGEPPRHIVLPLTRGAAAERPVGGVVDAVVGPF